VVVLAPRRADTAAGRRDELVDVTAVGVDDRDGALEEAVDRRNDSGAEARSENP